MPPYQAALTVIIGLIVIAGPMLWWVFYRMDSNPDAADNPVEPVKRLSADEIARIQDALRVELPSEYAAFLQKRPDNPDSTAVIDDGGLIIELTEQYRNGAYGLPPWPGHFIYVGDQADACPYALNCESGELLRLHKGNISAQPITRYEDFPSFIRALGSESAEAAA